MTASVTGPGEVDDRLRARLLSLFREELQDNLRVLEAGASRLFAASGSGPERGLVDELFRAAHSLKGAAHSAGVAEAVVPCTRLEDLLAAVRSGTRLVDEELRSAFADDVGRLAALARRFADEAAASAADSSRSTAPGVLRARVDVDALDQLVRESGALVMAAQRLERLHDQLAGVLDRAASRRAAGPEEEAGHLAALEAAVAGAEEIEREVRRTSTGVARMAQRLRMQAVVEVAAGLEPALEEVCRSTGKQARLVIEGGDVEVDRDIGDALREPLLHLVRNAVDHGIEAPTRRRQLGKPPEGTVRLSASLDGGLVRLAVTDDGGGIDVAAIRSAAGDARASDQEAIELAFTSGISTASAVTDISGRGVGLAAVRSRAESLGGAVEVISPVAGATGGTEVVLHVPTTLVSLDVIVVTVGKERVALPAAAVERLAHVEVDDLEHVEGRLVACGSGRPVVPLADALGFPPAAAPRRQRTLMHLRAEDTCLLVDDVEARLECVLRRVPRRAAHGAVVGAVVLPSGDAALVANPSACVRSAVAVPTVGALGADRRASILLVEDTFTTRALEHSILTAAGFDVVDATDGAEAWRLLQDRSFDLVVSDVDMPRMSGIELCRAIRSLPRLGRLPVVLVTSLASDDDRRRGADAGADAYLVKSAFDQVALLDTVRRLL